MTNSKVTILIVEDNALNLELVTDLLELANFRVVATKNGEESLELATKEQPKLILMDISLPGIDGLEATRRLKKADATSTIPVLALTAHSMKGDMERAHDAGCCGYFTKPINTRTFVESLQPFLEQV